MTGQEFKRLYMSLGWTGKKTAQELGIDPVTLSVIVKREEVDKRTEYAMRWLEHNERRMISIENMEMEGRN